MQPVGEMALQPRENLQQVSRRRRYADWWNITSEIGKCLNKYIYFQFVWAAPVSVMKPETGPHI